MVYILPKKAPALTIRAGHLAKKLILNEGLNAQQVDIIPGAAGGPKGIGLQGLDQAIFEQFLTQHPMRRYLVGSSIGSWRFASILAWGAKEGTERLADLYTRMQFNQGMSMQDISQVCNTMLDQLINGREQHIVQHPDYHLTVMAVKSRHLFNSDRRLSLLASVAGIVATNTAKRRASKIFMQRVVVQPQHANPLKLHTDKDFTTHYYHLTEYNLNKWLMASGSIPGIMAGVRDIPDAPIVMAGLLTIILIYLIKAKGLYFTHILVMSLHPAGLISLSNGAKLTLKTMHVRFLFHPLKPIFLVYR